MPLVRVAHGPRRRGGSVRPAAKPSSVHRLSRAVRRLPYVLAFLFPLQVILAALGLRYVVYVLLAGGTAAFLLRAAVYGRAGVGFRPVWLFVAYVAVLGLASPGVVALFGFLAYAQFAVFWLAYAYAYGRIDTEALTRSNLAIATVVAIIGIYQYFFNRTLWGFATYGGVNTYLEGGAALRINSLLPSAMTLGAYLVVSALLALTLERRRKGTIIAVATCLACAALTGNKSTVLCLGVAGLYWLVDRGRRRHGLFRPILYLAGAGVAYVALLSAVRVWGPWLEAFNGTLFRAVAPFFFTGDTSQVSTLLAYWATLFVFRAGSGIGAVLVGNGLGLTRQSNVVFGGQPLGDFPVAESFFIQLVFEIGVVGLVLFHVVLWRAFRQARAQSSPDRLGFHHVLVALYANMIVVHVFSGPFLGFAWGYIIALLLRTRTEANEAPAVREVEGAATAG
jgi:hypothetical protein